MTLVPGSNRSPHSADTNVWRDTVCPGARARTSNRRYSRGKSGMARPAPADGPLKRIDADIADPQPGGGKAATNDRGRAGGDQGVARLDRYGIIRTAVERRDHRSLVAINQVQQGDRPGIQVA